ncbi:YitT family protein [Salicibibacter halophilus]|uniref:YitT family protein n=1 Tax=Salicibibacter halophilus TaxID=2502791 RepID=A0A514LLV1_9BACI|nr:YitT family protein [Salicibibacter halophilus]
MQHSYGRVKRNFLRWGTFTVGIMVMSMGIAFMIQADLGAAPWDVFHIGLMINLGLTVGSWSIIVGTVIIGTSALLDRRLPQLGSVLNMVFVGVFIDLFLFIISTPDHLALQFAMLMIGVLIMGIGIGVYIAPNCGAGPRDMLMLSIANKTGMPVGRVRLFMEITVLLCGWMLGGPVFIGTIIFSLTIGPVVGYTLPYCKRLFNDWLERGGRHENFDKRAVRTYHHDRIS